MPKAFRRLALLFALLAACSSIEVQPVAIEDSDMCSFCKMAISEKQFAAEIVSEDTVLKFDDVGCLLRYRQAAGEKLKPFAVFVTDHDSKQWINVDRASFVRSKIIKTPMGSGIVAYSDPAKAGSEVIAFNDLKP
jgi:copper chaperone NosL